jgi:phosphotransferase system HPr-like phosphotransfer protein
MLLEAGRGGQLQIEAAGDDEVAAVNALADLIESRFGDASTEPTTE